MRLLAIAAIMLFVRVARAQETAADPGGVEVAHTAPSPTCQEKWGCWDLLLTGQGAILGAKLSMTHVGGRGPSKLDAAFLAAYASEHHATFEQLSVHLNMAAAIGGGTAGNERVVILQPDFGWRADATERGGPFLRAGTSLFVLRHDELNLSLFEPLRLLVGYQILDRTRLLETGMTQGLVALGTYHAASDAGRSLARATELGGYATARLGAYRASANFTRLFPDSSDPRGDVDLLRLTLCNYSLDVTLCGEVMVLNGDSGGFEGSKRFRRSLYLGLTLGFSP